MPEIVWSPTMAAHRCTGLPNPADYATGTIVRADDGHYSQVRQTAEDGITPSEQKRWKRLLPLEVSLLRAFQFIPREKR